MDEGRVKQARVKCERPGCDWSDGRASLSTPPAAPPVDAVRANGVGQDELVAGLKRALQHPAGDHDGWTDAGMEDAFFRWPVIVNALNEALAASPTTPEATVQTGPEWTFVPDERERTAILGLCADLELSPSAVMRQALRLYQADHLRRANGETVSWSGDAQRARDFAGPLHDTATVHTGEVAEEWPVKWLRLPLTPDSEGAER